MRFRFRDIPLLLLNPAGRRQLRFSGFQFLWPVLSRVAWIHRRTVARGTRVVAVVGSYGKTSTARALAAVLCDPSYQLSDDNCLSLVAARVLRLRRRDRYAVIEVGVEQPGEMATYVPVIRPNITVVTSIGTEHHRSMKDIETTRAEKAEMVRGLAPSGLAVLNGDDANVLWMRGQTRARTVTFGFGEANDVRAAEMSLGDWPAGTRFRVHVGGQARDVRVRLVGRPGVCAALAAVAVGLAEGFPLDDIVAALATVIPAPGRLEPVPLPNGAVILRDEYKSTLETIEVALDVLSELPARRRLVVLGEVSEPPGKQGDVYRHLGGRVGGIASRAIFLCRERDSACRAGAVQGGMPPSAIVKAGDDLFRATDALKDGLGPGDVVLIKGRDTQRLDRITLLLQGRAVGCRLTTCKATSARCGGCPSVERGWGESRVLAVR